MPDLEVFAEPRACLRVLDCRLCEREAENSLLLGLLMTMADKPPVQRLFMACHQRKAVAFFTGHALVLTEASLDAIVAFAQALIQAEIEVPGVVGPAAASDRFASVWTELRRRDIRDTINQRIYSLERVSFPAGVEGHIEVAGETDLDLIALWAEAFREEALPSEPYDPERLRESIRTKVRAGEMYGWRVGEELVSMAGLGRPTRHTMTVSAVYTPPAYRRRGYASALVAAASQVVLDKGYRQAVLYTDLSNPTSNSIYQNVGFRPVCDSRNHWFSLTHFTGAS